MLSLRYRNNAALFKGNCCDAQKFEGQEKVTREHHNQVWQPIGQF